MKQPIKYSLYRFGLYPYLDNLRYFAQVITWLSHGSCGIAPPPLKRMVLSSYMRSYRLKHFVETGTYLGDTLAHIAKDQEIQATSIELDDALYDAAVQRFKDYRNITLLHGDSSELIVDVVSKLTEPTLFWLDGHYSGGGTAKGGLETPVSMELEAILQSPIYGHVILIDDLRCFNGTHDYPHLDELLASIRSDGRYKAEVSADILRLTPKD